MSDRQVPARRSADLETRLHAFALDRLLGWALPLAVGLLLASGGRSTATAAAGALATGLLVALASAAALGAAGATPGRLATGLRVVGESDGRPVGFAAALCRQGVLALAGLPTCGLGLVTLAWSAAADPGGRRQGWHDRVVGTCVVDVRPVPQEGPSPARPPSIVNVTAMRLAHPPPAPPVPAPVPVSAGPRVPVPAGRAHSTVVGTAPPGQGSWRLHLDSGDEVDVVGLTLLGRDPAGRPGETVAALVPLTSADMSVSKTHAQVDRAADGSLVVVDRGSTNGSVLVRRGVTRHLQDGRPATLLDGDVLRLGDRRLDVRLTR